MRPCPSSCGAGCRLRRREFLKASAWLAGAALLGGCGAAERTGPGATTASPGIAPIQLAGPGTKCVPVIKAAFVPAKSPWAAASS